MQGKERQKTWQHDELRDVGQEWIVASDLECQAVEGDPLCCSCNIVLAVSVILQFCEWRGKFKASALKLGEKSNHLCCLPVKADKLFCEISTLNFGYLKSEFLVKDRKDNWLNTSCCNRVFLCPPKVLLWYRAEQDTYFREIHISLCRTELGKQICLS